VSLRDALAAFFDTLKAPKEGEQKTRPAVAGFASKRPIGKANAELLRRWAQTNEWVRTAIDLRRSQVSSNDWDIVPIDPRQEYSEELQAQLLNLFMLPNPRGDSFRSLIEPAVEDLLVLDAGCVEIVRTVGGLPARLYVANGADIRIDPTWDGTDPNSPRYHWFPRGRWVRGLSNEDLVYMMTRPASYRVIGLSTLEILQSTIESDLQAAEYNRGLVTRAAPAGVLNLGEDVAPDQVDAFRAYYEAEVSGRSATAIMGGAKSVQWMGFGQNNREMQFMQWQLYLVRKVAAVFGVAAQDLGITGDLNRATAEVQQEISEDRGLRPLMLLVEEYINREIVGSFVRHAAKKRFYSGEWDITTYRKAIALSMLNPRDPRTLKVFKQFNEANLGNLHFNYRVATGRSRREIREDVKTYLNELPIWTINEARGELNLDPIEGGDQILIPTNLGPVPLDAFIGGSPLVPQGQQQPLNEEQEKYLLGLDGKPIFLSTRESQEMGRAVLAAPEGDTVKAGPRSPSLARLETDLGIRLGRWFRRYAAAAPIHDWAGLAVSLASELKTDKKTAPPSPALARLRAEIALFENTEVGHELQDLLRRLLAQSHLASYTVGGQIALEQIGVASSFELVNQAVIDRLEQLAYGTVSGISETTHTQLADILARGAAEGAGVDTIARDITNTLKSQWPDLKAGRARTIANTEVNRAMSKATRDTYSRNGIEKQEWITTGDDRVCPVCEANEAQGAVKSDFSSGDTEPPAHANCRCALIPVIPAEWNPPDDPWIGGDEGAETLSMAQPISQHRVVERRIERDELGRVSRIIEEQVEGDGLDESS
jgi:SPP1 gp7 family putative phage head morphogenesis protein